MRWISRQPPNGNADTMIHRSGLRLTLRLKSLLCSMVVLVVLGGCAAQQLHLEGEALIQRGEIDRGLERIQDALRIEPTNARFRASYLDARDRAMLEWLRRADTSLAAGDTMAAENWYRSVLNLDPNHPRARSGIERIRRGARHTAAYGDAERLWGRRDSAGAMRKLREILTEDPAHAAALALSRQIEISSAKPAEEPELSGGMRRPITIEFKDTPIRQVFEVLARTSGLNFVFDRDVRQDIRATIFFRNSTVEAAMKVLLLANQLEYRVLDSNSILVYPNTAAKVREYQTLVGRVFYLNNAEAKQVMNSIKSIVKTRDIIADDKQNMIIMRDSPEALRVAERIVAMHDMPEPEVMLEVEVLEVKRSRLLELGINWPSQLVLTPLASTAGGTVTVNDLRGVSGATLGAAIGNVTINARRTAGDTNLLANPRIRSKNKEKARVMVGDRVPNITTTSTSTGFVSETVQYIDVGLKLEVEPTIYPDDEVGIKIGLEVSSIVDKTLTKSGSLAYQIGTRNANAVLRLRDGENQVLAGLISDEDRSNASRVPGLGDIPIIGRLFGSQSDQRDKTEIVLSITPRVIRNMQRPPIDQAEFFTGTEASLKNRGIDGLASTGGPIPGAAGVMPGMQVAGGQPLAAPPLQGATTVGWQGPAQARAGSTFTVQLSMQAGEPITSVPVAVSFDARLLEVASVSEGDFLRQGGGRTTFSNRVDRGSGQIFGTVTRADNGSASGGGGLMSITFRALAPAPDVRLQILSIAPVGAGGRSVSVAVPAPFSLNITP
jgi:general secretion pathway protein D